MFKTSEDNKDHADYTRKNKIRNGNGQDAPVLTNGLRKCGIYTQWNFTQS
jgi:hypothetical protein